MRPGECLVIGGMISQTVNRSRDQVPLLGSVPVLGQLFRSDRFQKDETELLVLVTPRLTQPSQLDLPANFQDPKAIGHAVTTQLTPPPYVDAASDAVRGAVRPEPIVLNPPITVAPPPPLPAAPVKAPKSDLTPADPKAADPKPAMDMSVPDLFNKPATKR
jgi:pilus assembly protein CpaC